MFREEKMSDMSVGTTDYSELVYAVGAKNASELCRGEIFSTENRTFTGCTETAVLELAS
jgi:hypothetical protein